MNVRSNLTKAAAVLLIAALLAAGCKKAYFQLTDESHSQPLRFTTTASYYERGRTFSVNLGKYSPGSGDSTVLFIEGRAVVHEAGQASVATMDLTNTARIYMLLPVNLELKRYGAGTYSICEIIGGGLYPEGKNLFECRAAELTLDSLRHGKYYGSFSGRYTNADGRTVTISGAVKAGRK
jgi:hypothetical protein